MSRQWVGQLAHYRRHRNDEHRDALIDEALRYTGFHLESVLANCPYWSEVPLARRAAVLLFLVDRGVVVRTVRDGQVAFEVDSDAESWLFAQPALAPYLVPMLDLITSLRSALPRRAHYKPR